MLHAVIGAGIFAGLLSVIPIEWVPKTPAVPVELPDAIALAEDRVFGGVDRPGDEETRIQFLAEVETELIENHGRTHAIQVAYVALFHGPGELVSTVEYRTALALIDYSFEPTAVETIEAVAPYWPLPARDRLVRSIRDRVVSKITVGADESPFRLDFSPFRTVLEEAWAKDIHDYDGIIDLMYEIDAPLAYKTLLDMTSDESVDDAGYDQSDAVLIPYHDYYIEHPEQLPEGTIPRAKEHLSMMAESQSLWARAFVAEVLNKVPYMRDPAIEAALRKDPHWLIQRRMAYLDEEAEAAE